MSFNLNDYLHLNKVKITTTIPGFTMTGKLALERRGTTSLDTLRMFIFTEEGSGIVHHYREDGISIDRRDPDIKEIVKVDNPTSPLQLEVKRRHEYVLNVDDQFHTSLVELAKKFNKTEAQLIQDSLNFYFNAFEMWDRTNR